MSQLPAWAQALKEKHPDGKPSTRENPIPDWLEKEVRDVPLWYIIREADTTRSAHPFLLLKEIKRQPEQWADIVGQYGARVEKIADVVTERDVEHVIFTGCGSAFFTAVHGAFVFPRIAGLTASAVESYELVHYFPPVDPGKTLVVGHSGTGGSIETVQAMEEAGRRGCLTLAVTNTEDTAVEAASRSHLTYVTRQECGPCISVVSTRILLVTMLGLALAEKKDLRQENLQQDVDRDGLASDLRNVSRVASAFLDSEEDHVRALGKRFKEMASFFLVGSGPNYFSAREGTLKIEEQAILVGKAERTGDFHHGALSVIGPDKPVIAIEAAGAANGRVVDAVRAANEGEAPTLAVTWSGGANASALADAADDALQLSGSLSELASPIALTVVFQLLGYYLGVERGFNPDTLRTDHWPNAKAWLTAFPLGTH